MYHAVRSAGEWTCYAEKGLICRTLIESNSQVEWDSHPHRNLAHKLTLLNLVFAKNANGIWCSKHFVYHSGSNIMLCSHFTDFWTVPSFTTCGDIWYRICSQFWQNLSNYKVLRIRQALTTQYLTCWTLNEGYWCLCSLCILCMNRCFVRYSKARHHC